MAQFSEEEIHMAKQADLVAVAQSLGYTPKRIGNYYTLQEMDSIRIYNRKTWYRWSRAGEMGMNGGSQIDFLRVFAGLSVKEAVAWLLSFVGYKAYETNLDQEKNRHVVTETPVEPKPFCLPPANYNNRCLYQYLREQRGISKAVIDYFVEKGLIYESKPYHNIVFKGNDKNGITRFASMRGIADYNGKPFKCDVSGNDKRYGFNTANERCEELYVFEGAIDLMSYVDLYKDLESNKIALGMVSDGPLQTFLQDHPQVKKIIFCLDRDEAGQKATNVLMEKYYQLGYEVEDFTPPEPYKDYNEWLIGSKNVSNLPKYYRSRL